MTGRLATRKSVVLLAALTLAWCVARGAENGPDLAVVGFGHEAGDKEGGEPAALLATLLEMRLMGETSLSLVERREIRKVLQELSLTTMGLVSREEALRVGRLVRADLLVYGNVLRAKDGRYLTARLTEARSGRIRHQYTRRLAAGTEAAVAEEYARVLVKAAGRDGPGPRLAVLPFRQTRGFDRLLYLQKDLRDALVRDFQALGLYYLLEREDMAALVDEVDLARRCLTEEPLGPEHEREAWYLLTGDYEQITIDGQFGLKLTAKLLSVGRGLRTTELKYPADDIDQLRKDIVEWVKGQTSIRRPMRYSERSTEFKWLLDRALEYLSHLDGVDLGGIPGVEPPRPLPAAERIIRIKFSEERAYDAILDAAINTLRCAVYINPEDHRPRLLLARALTTARPWMYGSQSRQRVLSQIAEAEALLNGVLALDADGPHGAAARRMLPGIYAFASSNTRSDRTRERYAGFLKRQMAALRSIHTDMPEKFRKPEGVGALRQAAQLHLSNTRILGRGAVEAYQRHVLAVMEWNRQKKGRWLHPYPEDVVRAGKETGRLDEAIKFLEGLPLDSPQEAWHILDAVGRGYREEGDVEKALRSFEQARQVCRDNWSDWFHSRYYTSLFSIAQMHQKAGREDKTVEVCEKILGDFREGRDDSANEVRNACRTLMEIYDKREDAVAYRRVLSTAQEYRKRFFHASDWKIPDTEPAGTGPSDAVSGTSAPVPKRARLTITRYTLPPKEYPEVDDVLFDGDASWLLCYLSSNRHTHRTRGAASAVYRLDLGSGRFRRIAESRGQGPASMPASLAVSPGHLWVGTFGHGLWRMDKRTGEWTQFTERDGLPFNYVTALAWADDALYLGFGRGERGGVGMMDEDGRFTLFGGSRPGKSVYWLPKNGPTNGPGDPVVAFTYRIRKTSQHLIAKVAENEEVAAYDVRGRQWRRYQSLGGEVDFNPRNGLVWVLNRHTDRKGRRTGWCLDFHERITGGWRHAAHHEMGETRTLPMPRSAACLEGRVWFAGGNNQPQYRGTLYSVSEKNGVLSRYGASDGLEFERAYVVLVRDGRLWLGTNSGLLCVLPPELTLVERRERQEPAKGPVLRTDPTPAIDGLSKALGVDAGEGADPKARAADLIKAAAESDEPKTVPVLLSILKNGPESLEEPACRALAGLWEHSLADLVKLNYELDYPRSSLPLKAIEMITDPKAVPVLFRLVAEPRSAYVRKSARTAVLNMGPKAAEELDPLLEKPLFPLPDVIDLFVDMGAPAVPFLAKALSRRGTAWADKALAGMHPHSIPALVSLLSHEGPAASRAMLILADMGAPAVPALIECVRSGSKRARQFAGSALGRIPGSEKQVAQLLEDDDPEVRALAMWAVADRAEPAMFEELVRGASDPDADVRLRAADGLGKLKDERAVDCLAGLLGDESVSVRNAAAGSLAEIGGDKALEVLLKEMENPNWERRARAVSYMGLADWAPLREIARAASDSNARVRTAAIGALGRSRDPWVIPFLTKALEDSDKGVAVTAAGTISQRFPERVDLLLKALGSPVEAVRKSAAYYVFRAGYSGVNELVPLEVIGVGLGDSSVEVRRYAVRALLKHKTLDALPLVAKAMNDSDEAVRRTVMSSPLLRAPEARDALIRAADSEDGTMRIRAIEWLASSPPKSAAGLFLETLRTETSASARRCSAAALGMLRAREAVGELIKALKDDDRRVRFSAAGALGQIGAAGALPALLRALEVETDEVNKDAIRRAIKSLEEVGRQ